MNRLLLFMVLLLNVLKCALEMTDEIVLQKISGFTAYKYCYTSGSTQLGLFNMACLITVYHMRTIRKDAEDPTRNAKSNTKAPLLICALITLFHLAVVLDFFSIESHNLICTFNNDHKSLKNEIIYSFIIFLVPVLVYNVYNL